MNIKVPLHTISAWGNYIVNGIFMGNNQLKGKKKEKILKKIAVNLFIRRVSEKKWG